MPSDPSEPHVEAADVPGIDFLADERLELVAEILESRFSQVCSVHRILEDRNP